MASRALLDAALLLLCIALGCSDGILCGCCKVMLATRLPPYLRYTLLLQFTELRSRTGMHILTVEALLILYGLSMEAKGIYVLLVFALLCWRRLVSPHWRCPASDALLG
jgi:hypothetical protein